MAKRTNKSAAVKEQKAAQIQASDDPKRALYRKLNYFPTPPWAARAGAEILKRLDPFAKTAWEPACGEGHMAANIISYFDTVTASDIHDHGYGIVHDFLASETTPWDLPLPDWVFTNPPFDRAQEFLEQGLRMANRGVALLCRIAFLEGASRFSALYEGRYPLTVCSPFCERVSMTLGQWDPGSDQPTCYAWFFFQKFGDPIVPHPIIIPVPPGTYARLHTRDDVRRWGKVEPAPLLEGLAEIPDSVHR